MGGRGGGERGALIWGRMWGLELYLGGGLGLLGGSRGFGSWRGGGSGLGEGGGPQNSQPPKTKGEG